MTSIFFRYRKIVSFFILSITLLLVIIMATISLIYIRTPRHLFSINIFTIGIIGWLTVSCATLYLSLKYIKECLLVFIVFFTLGFSTKAYLEPISDQLDHLHKTYEICDNIDYGVRLNSGLWQYSMNSIFLCRIKQTNSTPLEVFYLIDSLHGLYFGLGAIILFLTGRIAGMPSKWSFFAACMAFLFMGTSKFSYFRYYSYAPSFTSILLYWLWIGFFFFKKSSNQIILGTISAIILIIIISVNHMQEAVFLAFLLLFWILLNTSEWIASWTKSKIILPMWFIILFIIFFIFPQFNAFESLLNHPFVLNHFYKPDLWTTNQEVIFRWHDIYLIGRIWDPKYRVVETIGLLGLVSLIISPFLLCWNQQDFPVSTRIRIVLLGILPFLIFCIPLCHYIWVANVKIPVYYRIAYSSLFWCTIAFFLTMVESWTRAYCKSITNKKWPTTSRKQF